MTRNLKFLLTAISFTFALIFSSCSGDMHDNDETLKKYIVYSISESTLSIPSGTVFYDTMEAYNVEGTYGSYSFTDILITVDGYYTADILLKDSNGNEVYSASQGTSTFTTTEDLVIKINSSSVIDLTKWNNVKVSN